MLPTPLGSQNAVPAPSSLQSALAMDPNQQQHMQMVPPPPPQAAASGSNPAKRRRKAGEDGNEAPAPSEPRRLRRSHEACARCRSKKIKCDSKHPRCTACATAGTQCNQEDRHRQTLTPRGHTEHIEHQLAQCEALLKLRYPGFTLENLDEYISRENIDPATIPTTPSLAPVYQFDGNGRVTGGAERPPKGYPPMFQPPPPPPPGYPPYHMMPPGPPYGPPYHPQMPMQGPGPYSMHPGPFQHPYPPPPPGVMAHPPLPGMVPPPPPGQASPPTPAPAIAPAAPPPPPATLPQAAASKGTDPNGNDMSNTDALAKNFGVNETILSESIVNNRMDNHDPEDLAVGSNGLSSGRDRSHFDVPPRKPDQWIQVSVRRNSLSGTAPNTIALARPTATGPTVDVWLPKDRDLANHVMDVYFSNLNPHRPVFNRKDFQKILDDLYEGKSTYDPGYICSTYLVLALGTLSDLNQRAEADGTSSDAAPNISSVAQKLMPTWPQHDEFFQRALAVKPDLRVTVTSLQALILLHWYLYTERQGRTLWRLVGSLVRLSIELGLHHDPTVQMKDKKNVENVFTEEESQLRIRLWGIVLIHDRGTSILLGRPLAISPSDSNAPRPSRPPAGFHTDFSEHFALSHPIAEIQADIIISLYTPQRQAPDTLMRNATRIIKTMAEFRRNLPDRYKFYFSGTQEWPEEDRIRLVERITEDEGLTLLKLGIARILLLRALFHNDELPYADRSKALIDALITSHNIIIIHNQLIKFPNIAFFTSPIPLHIAAMVILFAHMSKIYELPFNTACEDLWLALDMLPRFRWRWERKDFGGGHPLLARLAEMVMGVNLRDHAPSGRPTLMCEKDWDDRGGASPGPKSSHSTPTLAPAGPSYSHQPVVYGPQLRVVAAPNGTSGSHSSSSGNSTPHDKQLVDVPTNLFYPFYPDHARSAAPSGTEQGYSHLLAQAGAAHGHGSYDSFMSEERDIAHPQPAPPGQPPQMAMWVNVPQQPQPQQPQPGRAPAPPVYSSHS